MTVPTDSSSLDTMAENNKFSQALIAYNGVMTTFKLQKVLMKTHGLTV